MDIELADLREDILDRMDNSVIAQQLTEKLRQKLKAKPRVTHAMNQAVVLFMRDADVSTLSKFINIISPDPDTDIGSGGDGVSNNIKTYLWPTDAFEEREFGGLTKLILNENEYTVRESNNLSLESLRYHAGSSYYGTEYEVFSVDAVNRRIYTPKDVDVRTRIIEYPEKIQDDDTYGSSGDTAIPISDTFIQTLSKLAVNDLVKGNQNAANRQQVINDTMTSQGMQQGQQGQQAE